MSSPNLSRRTLVAAAAVVPAFALPALAAPPADECELIALGPELEAVIRDWVSKQRLNSQIEGQVSAEAERLTGIQIENAPDDYDAPYWKARDTAVENLIKVADEGAPSWSDIEDRMYPLLRRILAMRAATMAGLAIQARAASLKRAELWDPLLLDDPSCAGERNLIELLCGYTRVVPVPVEALS